jgi:hypothetical protein
MLKIVSTIKAATRPNQSAIARHLPRLDEIGAMASRIVADIHILPVVSDIMGRDRRPNAIAFVPPVHDFGKVARMWAMARGIPVPSEGSAAPIAFASDFLEGERDHFFVDTVVHEVAHVVNNLMTPPGGWINGRRQIHGHRWVAFAAAFAARAGLPTGRDAAEYVLGSRACKPDADFIARRYTRGGIERALLRLADAAFEQAPTSEPAPKAGEWADFIDGLVSSWEMECLADRPMANA